jgi:hypothetical protein
MHSGAARPDPIMAPLHLGHLRSAFPIRRGRSGAISLYDKYSWPRWRLCPNLYPVPGSLPSARGRPGWSQCAWRGGSCVGRFRPAAPVVGGDGSSVYEGDRQGFAIRTSPPPATKSPRQQLERCLVASGNTPDSTGPHLASTPKSGGLKLNSARRWRSSTICGAHRDEITEVRGVQLTGVFLVGASPGTVSA